ncbi:MAG: hypothetical protein WD060_08800 [Pirellulales bacterium]
MIRSKVPATLVICGTTPRQSATAGGATWLQATRSLPVTWLVGIEVMGDVAAAIGRHGGGNDIALDIAPAACGSRAKLRDLLVRARDEAPGVSAVVLRGPTPLANRTMLVEQGISVALVNSFEDDSRGSRRPAPRDWPCRNTVWGLWEVLVRPHRPRGIAGWLGLGGMPTPKAGGLHVLRTEGVTAGSRHEAFVTPRLDRWMAWAAHRVAVGTVVVTGLSNLPAAIAGTGRQPLPGSVLRAA